MSLHNEFENAKKLADELQRRHMEAAKAYGTTKYYLKGVQGFWEQLEQRAEFDPSLGALVATGYSNVAAMADTMRQTLDYSKAVESAAVSVAMNASYLGVSTSTAYTVTVNATSREPIDFDPQAIAFPDYHGQRKLGDKFAKLDPALAKACNEIWEAMYGTRSDPERAALYMIRQVCDHLFSILAPDDKVRTSKHWSKTSEAKPDLVTRAQRIAYAVETFVAEPTTRGMLEASSNQFLVLYDELNRAHTRGEFNREKARQALATVYAWLDQWASAMRL